MNNFTLVFASVTYYSRLQTPENTQLIYFPTKQNYIQTHFIAKNNKLKVLNHRAITRGCFSAALSRA